jgi:diguanylate cyclase (GGDEF)-like protein
MAGPSSSPERIIGLLQSAALTILALDLVLVAALLWPGAVPERLRPLVRGFDALLMLSLAALVLVLLRRLAQALRAGREARSAQQALFDAMPTGLALWSADGRLQHTNADFQHMYAPLADLIVPGVRFEDLMRAAVTRGLVPEAVGREQAWLAERLVQHRNPGSAIVRRMPDGRWRRIVEQRLADGRVLGHSVDVTELEQARADADAARRTLRAAIDALPATFELYDADDRLVLYNRALVEAYPRMAAQLDGQPVFAELARANVAQGGQPEAKADPEAWVALRLRQRAAVRPGSRHSLTFPAPDGRSLRLYESRLPDGSLVAIRVDITELERARADAALARTRLEDAIEALPAGFELYDAEDRLIMSNSVMRTYYPYVADLMGEHLSFEALVRANHTRGGLPIPADRFEDWLRARQQQRRAGGAPRVHELPGGLWLRTYERPTREGGVVGVRVDVSELMRRDQDLARLNAELDAANAELRLQAETDALTGVANRRRFERELDEVMAGGGPLALLMLDIDYFKRFNDCHGHPAGDACLRRVAGVLTAVLRGPRDLLARLGGEEFAVLLPGADAVGACAAAQRCLDLLSEAAISHGDSPLGPHVTISIGIAAGRVGAVQGMPPVEAADAALYLAKRGGRARWHLQSDA